MITPIEVRHMTAATRAITVAAFLAMSGFFYWMILAHRTHDPRIGYATVVLAFWAALYWLRAPGVIARADDTGITYADQRWGLLLVFGEAHAAWSDVAGVRTRAVSSRNGSYVSTRVTVRDEGGSGRRNFSVSSRSTGYVEFLDALHARTSGASVAMEGLGDDPAPARAEIERLAAARQQRIVVLFAILVVLFGLVFALQRRG